MIELPLPTETRIIQTAHKSFRVQHDLSAAFRTINPSKGRTPCL